MVDKIDMSLDDIIKANRSKRKPGSGGGAGVKRQGARTAGNTKRRGGGSGGARQNVNRNNSNAGTRGVLKGRSRGGGGGIQKAKNARGDVNSAWKHDLYDGPKRGILKSTIETSKLLISNLDYGVSDTDIHELFSEFGPMKKAAVHYDRSGRSLGTAEVIFERRPDAVKALRQYNKVPLDGRPMNIELAMSDVQAISKPVSVKRRVGGVSGGGAQRRGGAGPIGGSSTGVRRGSNIRNRNPRAGGSGGGRVDRRVGSAPTAEELDAELDAYVNDMKI